MKLKACINPTLWENKAELHIYDKDVFIGSFDQYKLAWKTVLEAAWQTEQTERVGESL